MGDCLVYRVQATASLLLCSFVALMLFALWLASCPQCVLALPFPQHLAPGQTLQAGQAWVTYEYEYLAYGQYFVGEWTTWRVYASAQNRTILYTGYICKNKDCGLYLADIIALYGKPEDVHHAWTICIYNWQGIWVTVRSDIRKGRFGCHDLRRAVRSISFRE